MQEDRKREKKLISIKTKAFSLLAKRNYFSKELKRKLKEKGYPDKEISSLIEEFQKKGWLDDESLALRYIESQKAKGYGSKMIALKLQEKAGPMAIFIEESDETLRLLIEKKYKKYLPEKKDKVLNSLLRRGFPFDLIKTVLEDMK